MARPRSEQAHQAALDTTVELLLEAGVEGVTLEEVAHRSGVAKTTLYRHFTSRHGLIAQAARCCVLEHPTPDTGNLADDLRILFARFGEGAGEQRINDLLPLLIDAGTRDAEMRDLVASMLLERKRPIRTVLQLAQLRGEVGPDVDLDTALAMVIGPFTYRKTVERREVTPAFAEAVLVGAIAALRATAVAPAAG